MLNSHTRNQPRVKPTFSAFVRGFSVRAGFGGVAELSFRRPGTQYVHAADGFEALALLRGAPPDMLISDLNMPRMAGFELLSVVRRHFRNFL